MTFMKTLICWLMLAAVAIPLHSITTVTASTTAHNQQQPLMTSVHMEDANAHQTAMGADDNDDDSHLDDATFAEYAGRYVPMDTTWQVHKSACQLSCLTLLFLFFLTRRFNYSITDVS